MIRPDGKNRAEMPADQPLNDLKIDADCSP